MTSQGTDRQEDFVLWAANMATDFANGKTWRTEAFRKKLEVIIAEERRAAAIEELNGCFAESLLTKKPITTVMTEHLEEYRATLSQED